MTDKIENLMLEHFRIIRSEIAGLRDEMRSLKTEMVAVRLHVRGIEVQQDAHHDDIASLKLRLDRVERRLELVDANGK